MSRNTSISLGNYFDKFVQSRLTTGRFKNASEVVRAGLRLLEEEESKMIAFRDAVQEGVESGIANNFNPELHLKELKSNKKLNG
jgi:antitoxin ParD1/3/4